MSLLLMLLLLQADHIALQYHDPSVSDLVRAPSPGFSGWLRTERFLSLDRLPDPRRSVVTGKCCRGGSGTVRGVRSLPFGPVDLLVWIDARLRGSRPAASAR